MRGQFTRMVLSRKGTLIFAHKKKYKTRTKTLYLPEMDLSEWPSNIRKQRKVNLLLIVMQQGLVSQGEI